MDKKPESLEEKYHQNQIVKNAKEQDLLTWKERKKIRFSEPDPEDHLYILKQGAPVV